MLVALFGLGCGPGEGSSGASRARLSSAAGDLPDFVVTAVKGPASILPGNSFTASVTACNQGTARGAAQVDLVLSSDGTIDVPRPQEPWTPDADRLVGGALFELSPGACQTQIVQARADAPAPGMNGAYYLGALADFPNMLPELVETNNTSRTRPIGIPGA